MNIKCLCIINHISIVLTLNKFIFIPCGIKKEIFTAMVLCNNLPKFEQEDHMLIVIYTNNIYFFSNVLVEWPPDKFTKSSVKYVSLL